MKEIRVAIIGCGKIADLHAQQIKRVRGSRLVGVCDSESLMAAQLAERFQAESSFNDLDRLLKEAAPDVVHITTPPQSHFDLTRRCIEAGCHVYVEKPFSLTYDEAKAMVALAERANLKLTAGHNVQFSPEMIRCRDLVRNGALGGPAVHIESVFSYSLGGPSYVKALLGDGSHWVRALPGKLLHNIISHGVAKIAEYMDSEELTVSAHGFASSVLRSAGENEIIDELRVVISDNQRSTAYFTFTTQCAPPTQQLRLYGSRGALMVDNLHRTVLSLNKSNSDFKSYLNFFAPPGKMAMLYARNLFTNVKAFMRTDFHMDLGMKNLIEAFYQSIRSGGPPPIPYREILLTASIMDEIFVQLHSARKRPCLKTRQFLPQWPYRRVL